MLACPTLSGFSSIQLFTVFRAMSAAGSLGKPGERKTESIPVVSNVQMTEGDKTRQTNRKTDFSTGNLISPQSMERSATCLSQIDETSCLINCCRHALPDARWCGNSYIHITRSSKCRCNLHIHICNNTLTHYHLRQNWLMFCLYGENYTLKCDHSRYSILSAWQNEHEVKTVWLRHNATKYRINHNSCASRGTLTLC